MEKIENKLFKLYIFLLPITCIDLFQGKLHELTNSISSIIHFLGIIIIVMTFRKKREIKLNSLIKYLIGMVIILNISSVVMSIFLYERLGEFLGRTSIIAIVPHIAYYFQIIFVFYYNYIYLNKIEIREIKKWIEYSIILILIVAYVQIFIIITKNSTIINYYNLMEKIMHIKSTFINVKRVAFLNSEASEVGVILSMYILPYLFSNIIVSKKKIKYLIFYFLMFPIGFYARSSTLYIGFTLCNVSFVILYYIRSKKFRTMINASAFIITAILLFGIFININGLNFSNKSVNVSLTDEIWYLTVDKITDANNLSTIHRNSSIYTDYKGFEEYPILGVGNGNQGFFYRIFFPTWAFKSYESTGYYYGLLGWPGSGGFLPTYISGYGILGLILLGIYIYKTEMRIKRLKNTNKEIFYYMYRIGSISFIPMSIISMNIIGVFYVLFTLSLPFIDKYEYK